MIPNIVIYTDRWLLPSPRYLSLANGWLAGPDQRSPLHTGPEIIGENLYL